MTSKRRRILMISSALVVGLLLTVGILSYSAITGAGSQYGP